MWLVSQFRYRTGVNMSTMCEWLEVLMSNKSLEPPHDKTNKMACVPSEESDKPRHLPSLISLAVCMGGCPGWSESSLGAQSVCWFWHEAAHLVSCCCIGSNRTHTVSEGLKFCLGIVKWLFTPNLLFSSHLLDWLSSNLKRHKTHLKKDWHIIIFNPAVW